MNLSEKQKKRIEEISQKNSLALLLLFGSQVTGQTHKESDFDVAYLAQKPLDFRQEGQLIVDLMPVFKSDKVDLSNIKKAPPLLLKHIFDNNIILFCPDQSVYNEYEIYALKTYFEAQPLFQLREDLIKNYFNQKQYVG